MPNPNPAPKREYPEGMSVEVTFSPTLQRFYVAALLRDGEDEIFGFGHVILSEALRQLAEEIEDRYE